MTMDFYEFYDDEMANQYYNLEKAYLKKAKNREEAINYIDDGWLYDDFISDQIDSQSIKFATYAKKYTNLNTDQIYGMLEAMAGYFPFEIHMDTIKAIYPHVKFINNNGEIKK